VSWGICDPGFTFGVEAKTANIPAEKEEGLVKGSTGGNDPLGEPASLGEPTGQERRLTNS